MKAATQAPAALTVSDRSCFESTGLTPRAWKRALVELQVPHCKLGRRTLCLGSDWAAAVGRAAGVVEIRPAWSPDTVLSLAARRGGGR